MDRRGLAVEITVDNRIVTNHLSSEVGGAKRIYQHLSGSVSFLRPKF